MWYDDETLRGGDAYARLIEEAIRVAGVFLAFLGPHGLGGWQQREIACAFGRTDLRVIPIRIEGAPVPDGLLGTLHTLLLESTADEAGIERIERAIRGGSEVKAPSQQSPYRALEPFGIGHSAHFYGRSDEVRECLAKLAETGGSRTRFVAIAGASGSGKSSLARAGVIPKMMKQGWRALIVEPGSDPLGRLGAVLIENKLASKDSNELVRDLREEKLALHRLLRNPPQPTVILVDQFESLFGEGGEQAQAQRDQRAFVENLLAAAQETSPDVAVLITIRGDFLTACTAPHLGALGKSVQERQILLGPMNEASLRDVIEEPARGCGVTVDPALTASLVQEAVVQANPLPLLQLFLDRLWKRMEGSQRLTLPAGQAGGTLRDVLNQHADEFLTGLTAKEQEIAPLVFLQLVRPVDEKRFIRRTLTLQELIPDGPDAETWRSVIVKADRQRLLTLSYQSGEGVRVDLSHEALIGWKQLTGWLGDARELIEWKRRLRDRMAEWKKSGESRGALLTGFALKEAESWLRKARA